VYSRVVRDRAYGERLRAFLVQAYGLPFATLTPAPRGFFAETWQATTTAGERSFVKADSSPAHQARFEASLAVVDHLCRHGIDFIARPVPTAGGRLSTRFDGAVVAVFDWVDGRNVETDETKPAEYALLARVYRVPLDGLVLPVEDFAGSGADDVRRLLDHPPPGREAQRRSQEARELLAPVTDALAHREQRLRHFAALCRPDRSAFRLTHGDAGGNLVVDGDRYTIVDWDEAMLAPPERDAWVMCCRDRPNRPWAQALFEDALRSAGIPYTLRPERLAYYAYAMYFFYLAEILAAFLDTGGLDRLTAYLDTDDTWGDAWILECLRYADGI